MTGLTVSAPSQLLLPLKVRGKTLMGPGPSNVPLRVTRALSLPVIGHFHQATFEVTTKFNFFPLKLRTNFLLSRLWMKSKQVFSTFFKQEMN